jgi:hypothetical protein
LEETLEMLREECAHGIERIHQWMDAHHRDVMRISHRGKRYFITGGPRESEALRRFLFGDLMETICRAILGDTVYLFNEQYVVKAGEGGMQFAWHQDSGYLPFEHKPYMSCWIALDDMSEENGTVYVLPYSTAGVKQRVAHQREAGTNDMVGYHGQEQGVPVVVPAGSMMVFSSVAFHRSGSNRTERMRRVYLPQYSASPIRRPGDSEPFVLAVPFLIDGRRVCGESGPPGDSPEWRMTITGLAPEDDELR